MLASMVRDRAVVEIIDAYSHALTIEETVKNTLDSNPDLVGIGLPFSFSEKPGRSIALGLKKSRPDLPIIMGGIQATFRADVLLEEGVCDAVAPGESELTFSDFIDRFTDGGIEAVREQPPEGLMIIGSDGHPCGGRRPFIEDLDSLPFPSLDLLPGFPDHYEARLEGARGCRFKCPFCASCSYWGGRFRGKSPGRILDEIRILRDKWGIGRVSFADDTFNQDRERAREIAKHIADSDLGVEWGASCNPSLLDEDDLKIFARSGMTGLFLGVESGSKRVLKSIRQGHDLKKVMKLVEFAEGLGISVHASFMIGLPDETSADIELTIEYARELPASSLGFHIFHPLPGSEFGENPDNFGIQFVEPVMETGAIDSVAPIRTKHLGPMEILDYYYRARGLAEERLGN